MLRSPSIWVISAFFYVLFNFLAVEAKSIVEYEKMQERAEGRHYRRNGKRSLNTTEFRYNTSAAARMLLPGLK